ncbi:MAG: hypothetical protein ACRDOX_13385 [Nocardioides sp.]
MRTALRLTIALVVVGLAVVLLVGCGTSEPTAGPAEEETSSDTTEPTPSPSETLPNGPIDFTEIALISESNVEGTVSPRAVVLDNQAAVEEFAGRFSGSRMGEALAREYDDADVPDDEVLVGAVVGVSCEAPSDLQVEKTSRGVAVTAPAKVSKVQCLVPVTTVALVSVSEAAV